MVTQWGLSEKMGPMLYAEEEGEVFLGRTSSKSLHMSDETAKAIDGEIKVFINRNYERAEKILKDNMDILHTMKDALMKYETIDAKQIDDLMDRVEVREPAGWTEDKKPEVKPESKNDDEPKASSANEPESKSAD
jgi:cell division protease FtsH